MRLAALKNLEDPGEVPVHAVRRLVCQGLRDRGLCIIHFRCQDRSMFELEVFSTVKVTFYTGANKLRAVKVLVAS
jgi:hypothetical protein